MNGQQGEGKNRKLADARTRARGQISFTSFLPSPSLRLCRKSALLFENSCGVFSESRRVAVREGEAVVVICWRFVILIF